MSRYIVGEKVVAVFYVIENQRRFKNPMFCPWEHTLQQLLVKTLTVAEQHAVVWDQDPSGEKEYTGFILQDVDGQPWVNQYPAASYGQISDACDYYFDRQHPDGTKYSDLSDDQMTTFEDVTIVIDRVKRGVRQLATSAPDRARLLQVHLDWLIQTIERETGAAVVFEPVWKDHPDVTRAVLVWEV